jgi:hypothetical protein
MRIQIRVPIWDLARLRIKVHMFVETDCLRTVFTIFTSQIDHLSKEKELSFQAQKVSVSIHNVSVPAMLAHPGD